MHRTEKLDIRQHTGIVDLRGSYENITKDSSKAVADHLSCEQKDDAPARADPATIEQLHSGQGTETVGDVALERLSYKKMI